MSHENNENIQFKTITALGDGNCSFNSFAIGLTHLIMTDQLDNDERYRRYPLINQIFSDAGLIATTASLVELKAALKKELESSDGLNNIQLKLSLVLRKLSIGLLEQDSAAKENLGENLLAVFENSTGDDIFQAHSFIKEQFKNVKEQNGGQNSENQKAVLKVWWDETGYQNFLNGMATPGKFAGDIELSVLADHFMIDLMLKKDQEVKARKLNSLGLDNDSTKPKIYVHHSGIHWDCDLAGDINWINSPKKTEKKAETNTDTNAETSTKINNKWIVFDDEEIENIKAVVKKENIIEDELNTKGRAVIKASKSKEEIVFEKNKEGISLSAKPDSSKETFDEMAGYIVDMALKLGISLDQISVKGPQTLMDSVEAEKAKYKDSKKEKVSDNVSGSVSFSQKF